jgi:hypothetical protein
VPRAAVVVEDRYSRIFAVTHVRPAVVADGLAELQVRWPTVPIVYCENRKLAEEWTCRFLAAARAWARQEPDGQARTGISELTPAGLEHPPPTPASCARGRASTAYRSPIADGSDRRSLQAWYNAHPASDAPDVPPDHPTG